MLKSDYEDIGITARTTEMGLDVVHLRQPSSSLPRANRIAGFTLIEIAIVVLIVAMTLTMGLSALNAYLAKEAVTLTQQRQQAIKDALLGFLMRNNRLPCPDANFDGVENALDWTAAGTKQCLNLWGPIPYLSLGLSKETALDGWANPFDYYVSPNWAFDAAGIPFNLNTNTNAPGLIPVWTRTDPTVATKKIIADPTASPPSGAVVVVVSHGPNGAGAFSTQQGAGVGARVATINLADIDEAANAPNAPTAAVPILVGNVISGGLALVTRDTNVNTDTTTANVGGVFDDVVLIIRREEFTVTMTKSGLSQPVEGRVATAFQQAQAELIGFMKAPANVTPATYCSCTPVSPETTCTCNPTPLSYNLPPTACSPACTLNSPLPLPSVVDPCSTSTPQARIGYTVVYDISRSICGGPPTTPLKFGLAATLLEVNAPITDATSPCFLMTSPDNQSKGGGGVIFTSTCLDSSGNAIPPNTLSKAYLQGIQ